MKPAARNIATFFLCTAFGLLVTAAAFGQTHRRDELRRGVVKLVATSEDLMEETGSGVAIGSDEGIVLILTAAHVVAGADTVEVTFYDKPYVKYPARAYERRHDDLDIAVVIAELGDDTSLIESLPTFSIGGNGSLEEGAAVTAIGHPLGTEWQQSPNTVAGLNDQDDFRKFIFTNIRIDRGNSGGPILDERDMLIGLVSRKAPLHTVGIKMKEVMAVLNEWRIPTNHLELATMTGSLRVDSQPIGAQVLLDDELAGSTSVEPAVIEDVEPGRHRIEVRKSGYRPWKRSVRVEPGSEKELLAELEALPGTDVDTETPVVTLTEASMPTAPDEEAPELVAPLAPRPPESSVNRAPVATPDGAVTDEDSPMIIDVLANDLDADGDPLRISEVDRRSEGGGAVASDGVLVTYIPAENFSGGDSFAYTVMDSDGEADSATVTITVVPFNDPPEIPASQELSISEGAQLDLVLEAADPDGDTLAFSAAGLPDGAVLDASTGRLTYSPTYAVTGSDTEVFEARVTVDDGEDGSAAQDLRIVVSNVDGGVDPGDAVTVAPLEATTGKRPVEVTFDAVTSPGVASVVASPVSPEPPPLGLLLGGNTYFDVASTAATSGGVTLCVDPAPLNVDLERVTLQQLVAEAEPAAGGPCAAVDGCWVEIGPASPVGEGERVCGQSNRLGKVALFERLQIANPVDVVSVGTDVRLVVPLTSGAAITAATWNWGDGAQTPAALGGDAASGQHSYGAPGVYSVGLDLVNGETLVGSVASRSPIFVHRPGEGQVNGKGWFESPAGAYPGDPRASGRFEIDFGSRYRSGSARPDGKATFRFDAKGLRFKADSQEWLLVKKGLAILEGRGTIDRQGAYRFRLSVVDGETAGTGTDRVRVQIWTEASGGLVYDSQRGDPDGAHPKTRLMEGRVRIN